MKLLCLWLSSENKELLDTYVIIVIRETNEICKMPSQVFDT